MERAGETPAPLPTMTSDVGDAEKRFFEMLDKCRRKSYDNRHFYHPDDIKAWMLIEDENHITNVAHLLQDVQSPSRFHTVARLEDSAMVVFAVLVSIRCGNLLSGFLQYFREEGDLDRAIPDSINGTLKLQFGRASADIADIISRFDQERWAFIPAKIQRMHEQTAALKDRPFILPFCKKQLVGEGGTAVVYKVLIQEDLMPNTLRGELAGSEVEGEDLKKYYQLAVKSYKKDNWGPFDTERNNFQGIRNIVGIVKYLGCFEYNGSDHDDFRDYNILLEYGEQDLEEYLADAYPPVLNSELINFWKKIFRLANTLDSFHNCTYVQPDGTEKLFNGWHGDIKPNNILYVQQQFKLADFGYAKFEGKSNQMSPTTEIMGVTYTYGAPECDPGRLRKKTSTKHIQEIDTWSFGCVLSSVATWVVLGSFAYDQYREFRRRAINNLLEQRRAQGNHESPKAHDGFHDGRHVLQAVKDWHQYLRNSMRRSDTITGKVLDLVENDMLLANPKDRLCSKALARKLEKIIGEAEHEYATAVKDHEVPDIPQEMLKALLDLDNVVPSNCSTGTNESRRTARALRQEQTPRTIRVNKTERIGEMVVPAKVAGRQEVLESILGKTTGSQEHIYESPALDGTDHNIPIPKVQQLTASSASSVPHSDSVYPGTVGVVGRHLEGPWEQPSQYSGDHGFNARSEPLSYSQSPGVYGPSGNVTPSSRHVRDPRDRSEMPGRQGMTTDNQLLQGRGTTSSQHSSQPRPLLSLALPRDGQSSLNSGEIGFDSYPIGELHEKLVKLWERESKGSFLGLLKGKVQKDSTLENFIKDRDIIFLVDNGWSMRSHWECATNVLETLAMQIGPLDDSGLDLWFTIGDHKRENVKGFAIKSTFRAAMAERIAGDDPTLYQTSMAHALLEIFNAHRATISTEKRLTIIILTTGEWEMGELGDVERVIADEIRELCTKHRHFSIQRLLTIQFISFGDNPDALARLASLDNDLGKRFNIPDVIDTEPWEGNPHKMLLGSIKSAFDGQSTPDMRSPLISNGSNYSYSHQSTSANQDYYLHSDQAVSRANRSSSPRPSSQHTSSRLSFRQSVKGLLKH
ncbi:kinase-like domain-containing protein [Cercophora samala]|uniref:Kinase-like domain-containing protein n=1 Tax=Cercophora samala TaxID=330535 RepID=A0AA40CW82_9PEZI|nr:kinase-like domain-containing protein [Cercophora samala]